MELKYCPNVYNLQIIQPFIKENHKIFQPMSLTQQLTVSQWQTYLPFLYKFYLEYNQLNFFETISAKFYKEPSHINPNIISFIVAGLQTVQHSNQGYNYKVTERLIRAYDVMMPESMENQENEGGKQGESTKLNTDVKLSSIKEKNKLFYEKDITCLEDIIITQKRSIEYQTSVTFYAVALKNESIRILNASKLTGRPSSKRLSFLSERSPFLVRIILNEVKNINISNFSVGNYCEAAIIPLEKEVTIIKFNPHDMLLLCGCSDGTIVMINLNYQILTSGQSLMNAYTFFTYHKRPIKDLTWLTYSYDEKHSFASLADDGFVIWNKQNTSLPVYEVSETTRVPTSMIEVYPDQFVISGRDYTLKFFDIKKGYSYTYYESTQIITKLYNLTGQIEYGTKSRKENVDNSLRFVACEHTGKIVFWQGEREFEHHCHKGKIAAMDFVPEYGGLYLAIQKENPKMSIFSPILLTHCLEESG